ncbi:MAG: sugar transferase [Luteolibacter sp.]
MSRSRKDSFALQIYQLTDALLVWLAFWIAGESRDLIREWLGMGAGEENEISLMSWVLYIAVPFTPLILEKCGFYERLRQKKLTTSIRQILQGLVIVILLIGTLAVFAKLMDARRLILGNGMILMFFLLLARDRIVHQWLKRKAKNENDKERVILAGSSEEISQLFSELDEEITGDWHIVERFDLKNGEIAAFYQLLKRESVGRVIFSSKHTEFDKIAQAVEICELQGVEAWIAASFIQSQIARPVFDALGDKPMLVLRSTPELSWELLFKKLMDVSLALLGILVTLPLWIVAWIGIRISSPSAPAFFTQWRAGRYGKPFKMYKFRTMIPDAELQLNAIKEEHGNQMDGPVFKLDRDPRVFPFGALLRKLSIDELPQLINVLKGDMSLVGPRPLPVYEVEAFSELSHRRRLSVKPGITCEWQAGGRNQITNFEEWVQMDLRYIDNWSLGLDFRLLLKTIPAVLFGRGAK